MLGSGFHQVFKGNYDDAEDFKNFLNKYYKIDAIGNYILNDKSLREKQLSNNRNIKFLKKNKINNRMTFISNNNPFKIN